MAKMWNDRIMRSISKHQHGPMTRLRMMTIFRLSDLRIDCALFRRPGAKNGGMSQKWHDRRFRSRFAL